SINDVTVTEGSDPTADFIISLNVASAVQVDVNYATVDGTATSAGDYTATTGTVSFAPAETSKTISVPINDDALAEGTESFTVTLSNNANAVIGDGSGLASIIDDEQAPLSCGEPAYSPSTDQGIFLWQDCATSEWHLRTTGGGSSSGVRYKGDLTGTQNFTSVAEFSIEASDTFDTANPLSVVFDMKMIGSGQDGMDFTFPTGAEPCLDISKPSGATVFVGASKQVFSLPLNIETLGVCN
ncbi:MAG: Calx-beta domain-containing protein, partial [Gammaproteobacteria bacterium]